MIKMMAMTMPITMTMMIKIVRPQPVAQAVAARRITILTISSSNDKNPPF